MSKASAFDLVQQKAQEHVKGPAEGATASTLLKSRPFAEPKKEVGSGEKGDLLGEYLQRRALAAATEGGGALGSGGKGGGRENRTGMPDGLKAGLEGGISGQDLPEDRVHYGSAKPAQQWQGSENKTGLSDNLRSGIESLSGFSMDDVRVHYNSGKPAQLNAHAYAQGADIHIASGQEKHLPHEAWHVVQQKQGRVKPAMQMKGGVNINDDKELEKEADAMGRLSLNNGGSTQSRLRVVDASSSASVQRVPKFGFELQAVNAWIGKEDPPSSGKYKLKMGKYRAYSGDLVNIESDDRDMEIITRPVPTLDNDAKSEVRKAVSEVHDKITAGQSFGGELCDSDQEYIEGKAVADKLKMTSLQDDYAALAPADKEIKYKVQMTFGSKLSELNRTMNDLLSDSSIWRDADDPAKIAERKAQSDALAAVPDQNSSIGGLVSILVATAVAIKRNKPGSMNKDLVHFMQRTSFKNMYDSLKDKEKDAKIRASLAQAAAQAGINWQAPLVSMNEYQEKAIKQAENKVRLVAVLLQKKGTPLSPEKYQELKQFHAQKAIEKIGYGAGKAAFTDSDMTLEKIYEKLIADEREDLYCVFNLWAPDLDKESTADLEQGSDEPGTIMEARRIKNTAIMSEALEWMKTAGGKF